MPETIARDDPGERECLRCYIRRMLRSGGCDNTKKWTVRWRDRRVPGDEGLLSRLEERGGICCDCEVLLNVWEDPDDTDARWPAAPARTVRTRSPCARARRVPPRPGIPGRLRRRLGGRVYNRVTRPA